MGRRWDAVNEKKWEEMEKKITDLSRENDALKKQVSALDENVRRLTHDLLFKICQNSILKEEYNFRLLVHLFEKLNIEQPKLEYKFIRSE